MFSLVTGSDMIGRASIDQKVTFTAITKVINCMVFYCVQLNSVIAFNSNILSIA